jgi:hypothetical protein
VREARGNKPPQSGNGNDWPCKQIKFLASELLFRRPNPLSNRISILQVAILPFPGSKLGKMALAAQKLPASEPLAGKIRDNRFESEQLAESRDIILSRVLYPIRLKLYR